MTPFPEARRLVVEVAHPLGVERVPLDELDGRVFADDLVCPFDVPQFDNSQVDGYAVRSDDGNPRRLVGESAAGAGEVPAVGPGEAVRVFTGARLPEGADAVVMQEDARRAMELVLTDAAPARGENVRRQGEETRRGARFDVAGRQATPPLVGLAASFGLAEVGAYRLPRVAIVGTGDELVAVGGSLSPGQIYASNPPALAAAVRALGVRDVVQAHARDDAETTARVLRERLEACDVLITVGGVSVGDHDLVRPALAGLGVTERLWRVAMKPGKPFYFGTKGDKAVFGLPGNPVSALVTFALLVRPALRRMIGLTQPEEETAARLGTSVRRTDLRYEFVRATLADGVATPVKAQGSHMQTGLAFADALLHLPEGVASVEAGESVVVTPLGWSL